MTIQKPPRKVARKLSGNLGGRLVKAMGERILTGEFAPGMLLPNEAEWSKSLGASRTAVREAIKSLIAKGLVTSRPKIGSRVEPRNRWNLLDRDVLDWHHAAIDRLAFIESTQEARRLIEPGIAALAARKHTLAQLEKLAATVRSMAAAKNLSELNAADVAFHQMLLAAANNDLLLPFGSVIEKALTMLFEFTAPRNPKMTRALEMHSRIARAVAARDEKAARDAMIALLADTDSIIVGRGKKVR